MFSAAGKWIAGVAAGGIALGALLAIAAAPNMKEAPEPAWRLTGAAPVEYEPEVFAEAMPQDLYVPSSYRPDFDYDAEVWPSSSEYYVAAVEFEDHPVSDPALPTVTYGYTAAEQAADAAEQTVADATAEQPAAAPVATAPESAEIRKSELAMAGVY